MKTSMKVFQEAMIHSCVEVVVRETKRQCRILRIFAEHNMRGYGEYNSWNSREQQLDTVLSVKEITVFQACVGESHRM